MGKSAGSPPPAVDPNIAARAQTESNIDTATANQRLGMVNSVGPTGSVTYTADPSAPGGYRQVTALNAQNQGLYDLGIRAQAGALGTANDQIGRINSALGQQLVAPELQTQIGPTDFSADRQAVTDTVWGRARSRLDPMWSQNEDRQRSRLSNQGFSQNSTAHRSAMEDFSRSRNDAYDQALSSAILAGADEQTSLFNQSLARAQAENAARQQGFQNIAYAQNQPISQFSALLGSGNGVQMPGAYTGSTGSVSPTDVLGAYGLNSSSANSAYNARVANASANNQAAGQAAATAALVAASYFSDRRLKTDIEKIGERPDGIGLYRYRMIDDEPDAPLRYGVMADEVEAVMPDAVSTHESGYLMVNYAALER